MFTKAFMLDAAERTVRTFAQAWLALLASVQGGLIHVAWTGTLSVAGLAALVSLLNYVVAAPTQAVPASAAAAAAPAVPVQPEAVR